MKNGYINYSEISKQLNQNGYRTRKGRQFSPGIVRWLVVPNKFRNIKRKGSDLDNSGGCSGCLFLYQNSPDRWMADLNNKNQIGPGRQVGNVN